MNRRLLFAILLAGALAYLLRGFIEESLIQPLIYIFWIVRLYYEAFPQIFLWIALLVGVFLMQAASLITESKSRGREAIHRKQAAGPVESLAGWMEGAPRGLYFKWLVANRLGKLARALIAFQSRREPKPTWEPLNAPGWDPPREVAAYLESGVNGSFSDYPRSRWPFQKQNPTPLDIDPAQAIDYIESQMEKDQANR
ncbi:MAG: hypothetical protein HFACDABA_01764 [Anaerolineales bacterium]|nr:hypothetical protein [Anaerolineales bacterium]